MPTYEIRRHEDPRRPDLPPVMFETALASTTALERQGVRLETRDYAPIVHEGSLFSTSAGDRVRIERIVVTEEGAQAVLQEAVDVGLATPVVLAAGETWDAPETLAQESAPYTDYGAESAGAVETAPVGTPQGTYTEEQQQPDTPIFTLGDPGYVDPIVYYYPISDAYIASLGQENEPLQTSEVRQ